MNSAHFGCCFIYIPPICVIPGCDFRISPALVLVPKLTHRVKRRAVLDRAALAVCLGPFDVLAEVHAALQQHLGRLRISAVDACMERLIMIESNLHTLLQQMCDRPRALPESEDHVRRGLIRVNSFLHQF
jgi:hypothetical protein